MYCRKTAVVRHVSIVIMRLSLLRWNDDFVSANTSISFSKDVNPITLFTFAFSVFNLNNFGLNLSNTLLTLLPHYARNMPSGDAVVLFSVFRL